MTRHIRKTIQYQRGINLQYTTRLYNSLAQVPHYIVSNIAAVFPCAVILQRETYRAYEGVRKDLLGAVKEAGVAVSVDVPFCGAGAGLEGLEGGAGDGVGVD